MFKKEVLIFFQGFFLQKLKAGGKKVQMNTYTHTLRKKEKNKRKEREKIVSLNAKSLLMLLSQIRKRIVTHILNAVLNCCALTWKSLLTSLWESKALDHFVKTLNATKEPK